MNLQIIPKKYASNKNDYFCFGQYAIHHSESGSLNHFFFQQRGDSLFIALGQVYNIDQNPIEYLIDCYLSKKDFYEIDGSFIFIALCADSSVEVYSERNGLIPVFYRIVAEGIMVSTESKDLFFDYSYKDIDFNSVYDFLRYGMLIGDNTLSINVKLLQGGSYLKFQNNVIKTERLFRFLHNSKEMIDNDDVLIDMIDQAYKNAVSKRLDRSESEIVVFLSGGMDSRLMLAYANMCYKNRIKAASFGQPFSEEADVARKVAKVNDNELISIELSPSSFLKDATDYLEHVSGSDFFPQSYILQVANTLSNYGLSAFMTGSFIECYMGGTFLLEDAFEYEGFLSDYVISHIDKMKCGLFKDCDIELMTSDHPGFFVGKKDNLLIEAKKWDAFEVKDAIQAFITDIRDKRLVLNREITPALFLDYINPNFDKDLLSVLSKIPPQKRFKRSFYRQFFISKFPEYASIIYNNTCLPISFDLSLWKEGSKIEFEREQLFSQQQKTGELIYYPHYYSDFEGYSRYDLSWKSLIKSTLLKEDLIIGRFLDKRYIERLVSSHFYGEKSFRKQIVCLTSLELFFEHYFNGGIQK